MNRKIPYIVSTLPLLACLIKIWPSDRWPILSLVSYFPAVLLLIFSFLLLWLFLNRELRLAALISGVALALNGGFILYENIGWLAANSADNGRVQSIRILHWNVWGGRRGVDPVVHEIASQQPDVICISEYRQHQTLERLVYTQKMPEKWQEIEYKNLLVLSRIPLKKEREYEFDGLYGIYAVCDNRLSILFIDVRPNLIFYRRGAFESLAETLRKENVRPDVVLGDFNTPATSYSVRSAFAGYVDAYKVRGNQTGYTWASWFPVLRIDLVLVNSANRVLTHQLGSSWLSDHRWQYIDWKSAGP